MQWKYLRTKDEDVVDAVLKAEEELDGWPSRVAAFEWLHDVYLVIHDTRDGGHRVDGVIGDRGHGDLPGKWGKTDRFGVSHPYKHNLEAQEILRKVSYIPPHLDGLPLFTNVPVEDKPYKTTVWNRSFFETDYVWSRVPDMAEVDHDIWESVHEEDFEEARLFALVSDDFLGNGIKGYYTMTQHRSIESKKTVFRDLKERPLMRKDMVPTEPGTYSDRNHDLWTTEGYAANPHYWTSAVYFGKTRPTWAMADLAPFMRF